MADGAAASEDAAVAVFTALADPTRRQILDRLARTGPATVSELAATLPITRQAVAKHLAHLVEAGLLVAEEPEGRRVRYRARPEPLGRPPRRAAHPPRRLNPRAGAARGAPPVVSVARWRSRPDPRRTSRT